jgi:hypothetical protein
MKICHPVEFIPVEERASLLNLGNVNADLGHWVRVQCKGRYQKDLVHVLKVDLKENTATVLLVPRISLDQGEDTKGKQKQGPPTRPSPSIFNPEGKRAVKLLGSGWVRFKKNIFYQGLLKLVLPLKKVQIACPSGAELEVFARSGVRHNTDTGTGYLELNLQIQVWLFKCFLHVTCRYT